MKKFAVIGGLALVAALVAVAASERARDTNGTLAGGNKRPFEEDIEEDPSDRFITTRSGKRRPKLVDGSDGWDEDVPVTLRGLGSADGTRVLRRLKRCGDDDGGANRSRRSRRSRRARRARVARRQTSRSKSRGAPAATQTTTTTVRKVIQNGQVVSVEPVSGSVLGSPVAPNVRASAPVVLPQQQPAPAVPVQQPQPAANVPSIALQGSVKIN